MIKKLDLYIVKKFLGTFFFSILLILSISVVFDYSEKIDDFMDHKAPWDKIIFDYYFNFIPYYGKERVHKGFYTQRDEMMPGQTQMYVHDCHGQVVYFETQDGKGDLKEMMRRMSEHWSNYLGGC